MDRTRCYNMDCMEGMKQFPDKYFDLAIVDPPYGIDRAKWDYKPHPEYFETLFRVSTNQIIWGGNYFNLPHSEAWVCWDKTLKNGKSSLGDLRNRSEFELAWASFKEHRAKMLHYSYDGNIQGFNGGRVDYEFKSIHPSQKPVALYKWLLKNYAKEGDKIVDTHVGSQSSRIACFDMGFDFTGYELDKDYFEAGNKRFEQHKSQLKLFV